jgi:hypothetical protein
MMIVYKVYISGRFKNAEICHVTFVMHKFVEWKTLELITLQTPLRTHTHTHNNDPVTLQSRILVKKISLFGSEENS